MTAPKASNANGPDEQVSNYQPPEPDLKPTRVHQHQIFGTLTMRFGKTALCALLLLAGAARASGEGKGGGKELSPFDKVRTRAVLEEKLIYVSLDPGLDTASTQKLDAVLNNTKVKAALAKMPTLHGRLDAAHESQAYKAGIDLFDNLFGAPSEIRNVQQVILYPDGSVAWHDNGDADAEDLIRALERSHKAHIDGRTRRFRLMKLEARRLAKRAAKDPQAKLALLTLYRNAPAQVFPVLFDQLNVDMRYRVLKEVAELPLDRARHLLGTVADHKDLTIRAFVQGLLWALDLQE